MPQPNFVPVKPITSRNTQRSGVSGSMSICRDAPLTWIVITVVALPLQRKAWYARRKSMATKLRRLNQAPEAETAYRKTLSMSQQEPQRRCLTRRLGGLQKQ
jgi:predicted RNA polymerase sigma factor